jgi:hypothetical protein
MGWFSGSGPSEEPKQAVEVKAPSSIESAKGLIPSFNVILYIMVFQFAKRASEAG